MSTTATPLEQVADAAGRLRGVAQMAWDVVAVADLPAVAAELARAKSLAEAALVVVGERIEATDAAAGLGWASTKTS